MRESVLCRENQRALRSGVGRGEEVEEFAVPVEGGVRDVRKAVRERVRLVLAHGVDERGADVRGARERVSHPARVGRPRAAEPPRLFRSVAALSRDLLRGAAREVHDPQCQGVVGEDDLLSVGREDEVVVETRARDLDLPRRAPAVLRAHDELVLAALVGDVGDLLAVRRPGGRALVRGGRLREVAGIALFGRNGHDLAPELERGARAGGGEGGAADPLRAFRPARARLEKVARDRDGKVGRLLRGEVEKVERARLLVDDASRRRRRVEDGEVLEVGQALERLRLCVVGIDVELAVAVGAQIESPADPHRVHVVATRRGLGNAVDRVRRDVEEPHLRDEPAAVALPLQVRRVVRVVGDRLSVGRVGGAAGVRDREGGLEPALHGHRVELRVPVVDGGARRREEDGFAVGREALHDVASGMPRKPLRHAARGGDDVDVEVAVELGAEREERAVGAEGRPHLHARTGGDAFDAAAVEAARPDVVPVDEGDAVFRERRVREHLRRPNRGGRGERGGRDGERERERQGDDGETCAHGMDSACPSGRDGAGTKKRSHNPVAPPPRRHNFGETGVKRPGPRDAW